MTCLRQWHPLLLLGVDQKIVYSTTIYIYIYIESPVSVWNFNIRHRRKAGRDLRQTPPSLRHSVVSTDTAMGQF